MIGTDKPPWEDSSEYNQVMYAVECEECGYEDTLALWIPSYIKVKEYEIDAKCPQCSGVTWREAHI